MISVTGATGSIGRSLVRRLRQDGAPFTALVRDESKGRALGCGFVVGDFDDPGSVAGALKGVDRLFFNGSGAEPVDGEQPMIRRQKTVIDAVRAAGVAHVVKVSVWHARQGAKLSQGAHWEIEERLKASGLAWSVLQPAGFMQNFLAPGGLHPGRRPDRLLRQHSRRPHRLPRHRRLRGRPADRGARQGGDLRPQGPEALTGADVADKIASALGRVVGHAELPAETLADAMAAQGLPRRFGEDLAVLVKEVAAGSQAVTTTAVQDITGRPPRAFDDFLAANPEALRAALLQAPR